ncbi:MAG: class II fumarate hydratase [Bryobacteraceae bacterium]|nr:class II fumarate hydratase [Bryobacteraceae bacterium]
MRRVSMAETRWERDTMGTVEVPAGALYGAQTARAVVNFPISGARLQRPFVRALGLIKAAAAEVNGERRWLPEEMAGRIAAAAREVAEGRHDGEFVVDVYQTGSGTSTNMNANEVIARLAGEGVHTNDHVNRGQSSNDVIPTAMNVSAAMEVHGRLLPALGALRGALAAKAVEFHGVLKIGRTHLQDAVPMRLGQEFSGYARQVELGASRVERAVADLYELPLGGTAVGTGLNAPPGFAPAVIRLLAEWTGLPFREAENHFEAQAARDGIAFLSGALKACAVGLVKIANDIRLLGSGPRCGLGELRLPAVQPGSSIMPGKVNPVIAESLVMACAQVVGHDAAIAWCCAGGHFELNAMMPLMAYDLLDSIELLANSAETFRARLVEGLEADPARAEGYIEQSLALVTSLVPEIGYEKAAGIAKEAYSTGRTVREVGAERSGLVPERLAELLDPAKQV